MTLFWGPGKIKRGQPVGCPRFFLKYCLNWLFFAENLCAKDVDFGVL